MNARSPLTLAALTLTLACLVLAGTYALVRADGPQVAPDSRRTHTPTPTLELPTATVTSSLWTPIPATITPQPPTPKPPTATPTPEKDKPPVAFFGGQRYHVERVAIEELDAWRKRHGLRFARAAWCGVYGWINVCERVR